MPSAPSGTATRSILLDEWRGVACLLVFFNHTGVSVDFGALVLYGFTGVHLFFVLSGYLLFKPFIRIGSSAGNSPSIPGFYRRRLDRLYLPYLFALVVFAVTRHLSGIHPPQPGNFLAHLALVFNYTHPRNFFSINAVFWSLAIEVQFYFVLPLVCAGFYRLLRRAAPEKATWAIVTLFLVVGPLARCGEYFAFMDLAAQNPEWVRFRSVLSFLDLFGFGMAAAALEKFGHLKRLRHRTCLIAILVGTGTLLFLAANFWCREVGHGGWMNVADPVFTVAYPVLLMLGIFMVFTGLISLPATGGTETRPWGAGLAWVGKISYSLYLIHVAVQLMAFRLIRLDWITEFWMRSLAYGLVALPPTLVVSALMFRWIEKPCLDRMAARTTSGA